MNPPPDRPAPRIPLVPRIPDADLMYQMVEEEDRRRKAGDEDPDPFDVCFTVRARTRPERTEPL